MKRMRSPYLLLALLSSSLASSAFTATEFDESIPTNVVEQVITSMFGGQTRIYADLPEGFPEFELPRGMEVLASVDQGYQQRLILTSRFDSNAASALAYKALLDAGWQLVQQAGPPQPTTGFINPTQPIGNTQLCHDEHGVMNVSTMGGLTATYVHFTRGVTPPGAPVQVTDCTTGATTVQDPRIGIVSSTAFNRDPYAELQQYVPRLVLPDTGGMSAPMGGYGGGGGSSNEWEVRAILSGPWDIERVFRHFTDQMADQDWERDARVVGDQMASGSWTKEDGEVELVGSLVVLLTGENTYDLRFRLLRMGAAPGGIGNFGGLRVVPAAPLGIRGIPAGIVTPTPIGRDEAVRD